MHTNESNDENLSAVEARLAHQLNSHELGPYFGTPCGILAPFYAHLYNQHNLYTIPREDNAVAIAAGMAMAGGFPIVIMQNSGLGQSVNAIASLICPFKIPILFIISLRGIDPDPTPENLVMGKITKPLLDELGIASQVLCTDQMREQIAWAADMLKSQRQSAALLVRPTFFGWTA